MQNRKSEASEQVAVVDYCKIKHIPIFHIPNEGKRSAATGANLKRQGLSAGVPDLCIPAPRGRFHGLFIEMKYGKNKPTAEQDEWLSLLFKNGYMVKICYSFEEAKTVIDWYFKL